MRALRTAIHGMALGLVACRELPPPNRVTAVEPRDMRSAELTLESGCTPTGVERCFDALDDNCNGVIDEGCGLDTGILQFAIAWTEPVDVDLVVSGPDGATAQRDEPTASGLRKDRDCKGTLDCHGQNVENVYLAEGWPRRGRYEVLVRLSDARDVPLPVRVRLSARIGQRVVTAVVPLEKRRDERRFEFTL